MKDSSISMLKALGIILMVSGHAYVCSPVEQAVGLFHMPLFFIALSRSIWMMHGLL